MVVSAAFAADAPSAGQRQAGSGEEPDGAWFSAAQFSGTAWFYEARFSDDARFSAAQFEVAELLGPLVCSKALVLSIGTVRQPCDGGGRGSPYWMQAHSVGLHSRLTPLPRHY
ncbi:pentapeptide repeat-containing protein [Streptomyces azureus]|uniref:pentapeptide repeat-containing protein n=1 Tax=Streptomyces azureus TaxID=146537 RepID=UPI0038B449CF